ncbi:hypothetical protein IW141_006172, partial [Coemansia sp. RSA 355]
MTSRFYKLNKHLIFVSDTRVKITTMNNECLLDISKSDFPTVAPTSQVVSTRSVHMHANKPVLAKAYSS